MYKLSCHVKKRFPFLLLIVKLQHSEVLDQLVQVRVESCTALDNFIHDSRHICCDIKFPGLWTWFTDVLFTLRPVATAVLCSQYMTAGCVDC